MDPTEGNAPWVLTSHDGAEKLVTVNKHDDIVGQVAESVSKISDFVWQVTLKSGYKFSNGTEVNAQHVADCLSELNALNSNAHASLRNMTVTASGDLTLKIESDRQTHVMDAVFAEWVFVIYMKGADNGNVLYTGPFVIETLDEDQIDLVPNTYYPETTSITSTHQLQGTTSSNGSDQYSSPRPRGRVTIKRLLTATLWPTLSRITKSMLPFTFQWNDWPACGQRTALSSRRLKLDIIT
jgi:ABC-type transport system substrate-binding protein